MKKIYVIPAFAVFLLSVLSCGSGHEGKWTDLFNGRDLTGWEAVENPSSLRVEDGMIICSGPRAHLFYTGNDAGGVFRNFELKAMVMTAPGSNSGIFIHTAKQETGWPTKGYEVQVHNSRSRELRKTGSLYGIRNVYYPTAVDNEWFEMYIRVVENRVEVRVNGHKVIDYVQPDNPYRSPGDVQKVLDMGLIALQSHDPNSTTYYKDIRIRVLGDGQKTEPMTDKEWDTKITRLHMAGFPVIDFHIHLKGGLTIDEAIENSARLGINYGIAPNCGLKFPVTDDPSLYAYMDTVRSHPIFRGMQAEGREWVTLFSSEAIAQFDYVFTDALTWTDSKGRRLRIWIPEETFVDDEQVFMDELVFNIERILDDEPVDIYVNPTFLPEQLAGRYEELWTDSRIDRVIAALLRNNVALEINARYRIPSERVLRKSKEAGVKFTFGTNNGGSDTGRLEYSLEMAEKLGLKPRDMFMPREWKDKPVLVKGLPQR